MIPDHIKTYPMDELQESAYQRFADNLRMYAGPILEEAICSNLEQAHTLFADAAPRLAERLIALGLDERVKGYTAVSAISEAFKILQQVVVDREHREQLNAIRSTLEKIDGGSPEVIDV